MTPTNGSALSGLSVIDASTINAGPSCARLMADFGADVIKIEHPENGDQERGTGPKKDGISLFWQTISRNKKCITLNLKSERGQQIFKQLVSEADILIENFRPGILESWNLGWEQLSAINPRLIMLMITGFGQDGPYKSRAGFGTLAEAISGLAHITGMPDGPPTLPPFGLSDGVASLLGAFACMSAIYERDVIGSGIGQYIDLSLYEPIFSILPPQATIYDQVGFVQQRFGNRSPASAPRSAYKTKDGRWLAMSAGHQHTAPRVLRTIGGEALVNDPRFKYPPERIANSDELDAMLKEWIGSRTLDECMQAFLKEDAAVAPIYDIKQILEDPQYIARETVTTVQHPKLGPIKMQNVFPRMSRTPGKIRWPGRELGEDNYEIFVEKLGLSPDELERLRAEKII